MQFKRQKGTTAAICRIGIYHRIKDRNSYAIGDFCYLYPTMRKLSAFILLIPFAILFFGSMTLSSLCPIAQQDTCTRTPGQCCHQQTGKASCPKEKQADQSKDQKNDQPKDQKSDRPACCFDCPLCALITNPPFIRFETTRPKVTTEYAVRPDNLLTDYYQRHWKPPNAALLS